MSALLLDHLWQSTLFGFGAWVLTRMFRAEPARWRYWIWFAASAKFLVPFAVLVHWGSALTPRSLAALPMPTLYEGGRVVASLWMPASATIGGDSEAGDVLPWIGVIWAIGSASLLARWGIQWRRVRALVNSASPAGDFHSLPILTSARVSEPGVAGIWRPVLLLPEGIAERLTAEQYQAVLAHENCHVRRRDNLMASLHAVVESLFWFHPMVWWIGASLVEERERACDEDVLRSGHAPRTYAEGILRICQSCVRSNPDFVAGVSGADLMTRLEGIMKNDVSNRLGRGKQWMLGLAAAAALGLPVFIGLTASPEARGEAAKPMTAAKVELLAGKRVKLNYDRVDVRALLQGLANAARVNMLVSDKVAGEITVHLDEMPWEQALTIVLQSQGLSKRESNGIIFVEPAA